MTGEKGGLLAGLRAEALKSRHAAPVRLAVLMALPMPLLGAMPYRGVQIFSAWNYWYALFLPVSLSLVVACVARADARTRMRGLLGLGFPLGRAWWAKALWCLALCTLSNLVVFGIYLAGSAFSSQGLTAAGTLTMLLCALANTVTAAWMIPAGLFLTARLGMLAGIFCPLAAQLVGGFAWSLVPLPQLFPPSASMVIPTSFIPVLPSGEPLAADMALGGALGVFGAVLAVAGRLPIGPAPLAAAWAGIVLGSLPLYALGLGVALRLGRNAAIGAGAAGMLLAFFSVGGLAHGLMTGELTGALATPLSWVPLAWPARLGSLGVEAFIDAARAAGPLLTTTLASLVLTLAADAVLLAWFCRFEDGRADA